MNLYKKIILYFSVGGCFFIPTSLWAFLGEDLGLDLYKQIDEGFYELQRKQYEYEMTGQGEASVAEIVGPILAERGINCDINSTQHIEQLLGNTGEDQVQSIFNACGFEGGRAPTGLIEEVSNTLGYIKNSFSQRAREKSQSTYDIARIGLYNDGNIENSPFDLINDLEEIDRVIFSEELEYNGVPYESSVDEQLDDFLEEDKSYLYAEEEIETGSGEEINEEIIDEGIIDDISSLIGSGSVSHNYVCLPGDDTNGLNTDDLSEILNDIENPGGYTPYVNVWGYPDDFGFDSSLWGGLNQAAPYLGTYNKVTDSWGCDPSSVFCIIIEFENSNYGLAGGETITIEKILAKAATNLEKPANASLTQHKMQTNNFEIGAVIKNLPDMLRGFGIEVQSKPIPILEFEDGQRRDGNSLSEEKLREYYKNLTLDYDRRNDLQIFRKISRTGTYEEEQKVLETSAGMPTPYVEQRLNELSRFQAALSENNRILSLSVDKGILYDDMEKFGDQFAELERFVAAIEDFSKGFTGHVQRLKDIPTRSNN